MSLSACSSDSSSDGDKSNAKTIEITLTDDGCAPRSISTTAGPTTFKVTNEGSAAVTEFEVLKGDRILGEVENIPPSSDRSFSLTLKSGSYTTKCPGGKQFDKGTLEVAAKGEGATTDTAARTAAVATYLTYVKGEADQLTTAVTAFVAAVKSGDTAKVKASFASARLHYESIEPIAESFGDLDPAIDAREGDVPEKDWGGFHRIEKAVWVDGSIAGLASVADKLATDVADLRKKIDTVELEPAQIANGAVELLNEVSVSKITGEEDRYSHTDLSDFAGNVAGAKAAFDAVRPLLTTNEAALATELDSRFTDVQRALDVHKSTNAEGNGYALYNSLTPDDTRKLSVAVDALAEPLSRVAALVI